MPCAGFFICKVGSYCTKLIHDWYAVSIPTKNKSHAWEQDALWKLLPTIAIKIVDSWMFREAKGQFLRHVASHEQQARVPYFKDFILKNNIDVADNISNIKSIHYSTLWGIAV